MRFFLTLIATAALAAGGVQGAQRWTRFVSRAGFSVDRPADWTAETTPDGALHVVSGPCPREAAASCPGEAQIAVTSETIAGKPTRSRACWSLTEVISKDQAGPGAQQQERRLTCTIGARRFTIHESHWKGDKHAPSYGRISMRMAKSLRYPG